MCIADWWVVFEGEGRGTAKIPGDLRVERCVPVRRSSPSCPKPCRYSNRSGTHGLVQLVVVADEGTTAVARFGLVLLVSSAAATSERVIAAHVVLQVVAELAPELVSLLVDHVVREPGSKFSRRSRP